MTKRRVEYSVQFTHEDIYSALRQLNWWRVSVLSLIGCVLLTVLGVMQPVFQSLIYCGLVGVVAIVMMWIHIPQIAQKTLESPAFSSRQAIVLDEEGFAMHSDTVQSKVKWAQFIKHSEDPTALLLYMTPYTFYILPKRCFSSEDLKITKELIQSHVKKPTSGGHPVRNTVLFVLSFLVVVFVVSLVVH
ncbi:MAG: YcxB family protein [Candidatus Obscuribacterales bacterium]|nr:YcxB family protein [Candidatus Obscuribacterales bacterium]